MNRICLLNIQSFFFPSIKVMSQVVCPLVAEYKNFFLLRMKLLAYRLCCVFDKVIIVTHYQVRTIRTWASQQITSRNDCNKYLRYIQQFLDRRSCCKYFTASLFFFSSLFPVCVHSLQILSTFTKTTFQICHVL